MPADDLHRVVPAEAEEVASQLRRIENAAMGADALGLQVRAVMDVIAQRPKTDVVTHEVARGSKRKRHLPSIILPRRTLQSDHYRLG